MASDNLTPADSRSDSAFASIYSLDNTKPKQQPSAVTTTATISITDSKSKRLLPSEIIVVKPPIRNHSHHPYGKSYRCIGSGTSATVFSFQKDDTLYAVKQFRSRNKNEETHKHYTKKIVSEYCIASSLSHPSVINTFDLIEDRGGRFSTVMEYCNGGDLFSAITRGQLSTARKWVYFKQLVSGLAYLHKVGVAHRDIKPENLLLTHDGQLKISDFGVSDVFRVPWERQAHKSFGMTGSGPYAAPEVLSNNKSGYWGSRTDIWSAGVVLYCLFASGFCWHRSTLMDRVFYTYVCHYKTRTFDSFASLAKYSKEVGRILYLVLDPNPETRITSAELLLDPFITCLPATTYENSSPLAC